MYHMFDIAVAGEVGLIAAIVFQNIAFWCQHSRANGTNFYDGTYWTYNSIKAFMMIFPYLSKSQIDTAIKKLIENDLIIKGNYNKSSYDRTAWYALTEKGLSIFQKSEMDLRKIGNGFSENRKPIPYINTDIETDSISTSPDDDGENNGFAEFWELYPRKIAKSAAQKAWRSLRLGDSVKGQVLADLHRRLAGEWSGKDKQYIPHPTTYLHQRRWEDEVEDTAQDTVQDDTVGPFGAWRV